MRRFHCAVVIEVQPAEGATDEAITQLCTALVNDKLGMPRQEPLASNDAVGQVTPVDVTDIVLDPEAQS